MHIIGGGIIGLCSAWYLRQAGYEVTVIDNNDAHAQDNCSFGNSGIIVPSHSVPLASPGVIAQGMKWMFSAHSPFYIKPRMDPDLLRWLWLFQKSCTKNHVDTATPVVRDFHLLSKSLYKDLATTRKFSFDLEERGSMMLYRTPKAEKEELEGAERAHELGMHVSILSRDQLAEQDPGIRYAVLGGVLYHDDAHLYPGKFIKHLRETLQSSGVQFLSSHTVTGFITSGTRITHLRLQHAPTIEVKDVVLASGAWSGQLAKLLGLRLSMQDGKGYSVTLPNQQLRPALPSILTEARVAVTPMGNDLRIGGTLEVSHFSPQINKPRVLAILNAMSTYYPDFPRLNLKSVNVWHGFRPVTADGLPYIGRPKTYDNLIIAAGHAMLGMSLGPATGLLVSEIAQGKKSSLGLELFSPDRHTR